MYVHHVCIWNPQRPQEGIGSLRVGVKEVVSFHVGAGIEFQSSARTASAFNHYTIAPVTYALF